MDLPSKLLFSCAVFIALLASFAVGMMFGLDACISEKLTFREFLKDFFLSKPKDTEDEDCDGDKD